MSDETGELQTTEQIPWWEVEDIEPRDEADDYDPGDDCGRWLNGRLGPYYWCRLAGTEFCDWECPYAK